MIPGDIRGFTRANAEAHLATRGLKVDDLVRFVRPLGPDETLCLVASIPEGLANAESDIDLILIGRGAPGGDLIVREQTYLTTVERFEEDHEVNIELREPEQVEVLATGLSGTIDAISDVSLAMTDGALRINIVRHDELRMVHRLRFAVPLVNESVFDEWAARLRLDELPLYCMAFGLFNHYATREDAIAQVGHSQPTALQMLRIAMDELALALLASYGETNPLPKWRIRLLERATDGIGEETVDQMMDHLFPQRDADARATVTAAITFADAVVGDILQRHPQLMGALLALDKVFEMPKQLT